MRNFEERKKEIFRRSEKRIKERKRKIKGIITLSIPLCLLVIICSITFLPTMISFQSKNDCITNEASNIDNESNSMIMHNFIQVDIKGSGTYAQYHYTSDEASSVDNVIEAIYPILKPYESDDNILGKSNDSYTYSIESTKSSSYIITFTSKNGMKRIFILSDNKLNDPLLNIEVKLTNMQINTLKSALKLSD